MKVLLIALMANIFDPPPPAAGDYRSVVTTGLWSSNSTWQRYDGISWVAAVAPPTSSDGVITIAAGDSIRMNSAVIFDQVVVESGAVLAIFNTSTPTTFTLNDGTGADLQNNGKLYVSAGATLTGTGTVQNNAVGLLILRNQGILSANTTNDGSMTVSGTGNISNATLTNNGVITLVDFTLNLNNNATLINNDSLSIAYNADAFIGSSAGTGSLVNAAGGIIFKADASGISWINASVSFSNSGTIKGAGQYNILNPTTNAGIISPGNSPGIMTVNPDLITGRSPAINLEISSTGAVEGTNYDQLLFSTVGSLNTDVSGATLNVTDLTGDPPGTLYTILKAPDGATITGPFAQVHMSPTLGNLLIAGNMVLIQKITPLSLLWGEFTVRNIEEQILLSWSTLQESNTSRFIIERSINGRDYTSIGKVAAAGNSLQPSEYKFTDAQPVSGVTNYYRLQEVDLDGKAIFSVIKSIFPASVGDMVQIAPNPVHNIMQVTVRAEDTRVDIVNSVGRLLHSLRLSPGNHSLDISRLPAGIYLVVIYRREQYAYSRRVIKL